MPETPRAAKALGRLTSGLITATLILVLGSHKTRAQDNPGFSPYMYRAYEALFQNPERSNRGYHVSKWFTKDLDYGAQKSVIKASPEAPLTMCNAAVTETIVEAMNLYAQDHPAWKPHEALPVELWNTFKWTAVKPHLFSHNLMGYPPLKKLTPAEKKQIPAHLIARIQSFHSEKGMPRALTRLGIGREIRFEDAVRGDVITFDRQLVNNVGQAKYGGHSVVFLAFLDKTQSERKSYAPGEIVGFKYFSSQGNEKDGGLGVRWAYFKNELCPYRDGYQLPEDPALGGCADGVSNEGNKRKFPLIKAGHARDCCVKRAGSDGLRVGRMSSPPDWRFSSAHATITREYEELMKEIREYLARREKSRIEIELLAKAAIQLEARGDNQGRSFLNRSATKASIDMRSLAEGSGLVVDRQGALQVKRLAPSAIISQANRQVTTDLKRSLDQRVTDSVDAMMAQLEQAQDKGFPNERLDGLVAD